MPGSATVRRRVAPAHPRRVSGPVRPRAVPAGASRRPSPPSRTGGFERLRATGPETRRGPRGAATVARACARVRERAPAGVIRAPPRR